MCSDEKLRLRISDCFTAEQKPKMRVRNNVDDNHNWTVDIYIKKVLSASLVYV